MIERINSEILEDLLKGPLPGKQAQQKMAPELRTAFKHDDNCRSAAVLILLFPESGSIHTVFMKRNEYDGPHSGQISFPGGMYEEKDNDFMDTAIRETAEETGMDTKEIRILGQLTPLFIPVSNFCVNPYVGWVSERPIFNPDDTEVQYLLTPSLDQLAHPGNHYKESLHRHGYDILTPYIKIDEEIIWGATAMILNEFMALIEQ